MITAEFLIVSLGRIYNSYDVEIIKLFLAIKDISNEEIYFIGNVLETQTNKEKI